MNSSNKSIIDYLANLTDQEINEIKKKMNGKILDTEQELKNNLDQIAGAKQAIKIRDFECMCRTRLEENIKHLQREAMVTELMISLLRNHFQNLEQEESLPNKIEEKKRKESLKRLIAGGNDRIAVKKQHHTNVTTTLKEREKTLETKGLGCKCKADLLKQVTVLENANASLDIEIKLLTKYYQDYQDENLLKKYLEGTLLS